MSETDPGPLPISKMELAATIINGSPIYAKSTVLARRLPDLSSTFIYHLYYPHYCYSVKSPALAIILPASSVSLLLNQARFAPVIPKISS